MRYSILLLTMLLAGCITATPQPPPDAQVGVAFDRNSELASFADGLADPHTRRAVSADDPVRVASISKLVTAVDVMKLVEAGNHRGGERATHHATE